MLSTLLLKSRIYNAILYMNPVVFFCKSTTYSFNVEQSTVLHSKHQEEIASCEALIMLEPAALSRSSNTIRAIRAAALRKRCRADVCPDPFPLRSAPFPALHVQNTCSTNRTYSCGHRPLAGTTTDISIYTGLCSIHIFIHLLRHLNEIHSNGRHRRPIRQTADRMPR